MYYTIYQITNIINGKVYIGKHQTENINDNYMGSGKVIEHAIKKYGKENFIKEILFVFDNNHDMDNKEKEIINEEFVNRKDTYNIGIGGEGGPHFKGKKHSDKTKQLLSTISSGKIVSQETKDKLSKMFSGREVSQETKDKLSAKASLRYNDEKERQKMSQTIKNKYIENSELSKLMSEKMNKYYSKIDGKLIWIKNIQTLESFRIIDKDFDIYKKRGFEKGRIFKNIIIDKQ